MTEAQWRSTLDGRDERIAKLQERIESLRESVSRERAAGEKNRKRLAAMERSLLILREIASQDVRVRGDMKAHEARRMVLDILDVVTRHALDGLVGGSWQGDLPGEERDARPAEVARA